MEHTLQAYIERRSSAELLRFLEDCMLRNQWEQYAQTVPYIFEILKNRRVWVPEQILSSWDVFTRTTDSRQ